MGTTPEAPFVPLDELGTGGLFTAQPNAMNVSTTTLAAIQNASAVDQLAFLAYTDKILADGWRLLTCELREMAAPVLGLRLTADFGRDTLLALRLLFPVISPIAAQAILPNVLERTKTEAAGEVCHEETVRYELEGLTF